MTKAVHVFHWYLSSNSPWPLRCRVCDKHVPDYTHKKNPEKCTHREEKTNQVVYWVRHNYWPCNQNYMYPAHKKMFLLMFCRGYMLFNPDQHMVPFLVKSPWFYLRNPVLLHSSSAVTVRVLPRSRGRPVSQDVSQSACVSLQAPEMGSLEALRFKSL